MPSIIFYILKLSVALAVVYIFYLLVLHRLTFYNWNRWYLLGYTILAFLIPFINIAPILQNNEWSDIRVINWVPAIIENDSLQNIRDNAATNLSAWNIVSLVFFSGMLFLLARLVIQFISFYRMKKKAKPFTENGLTIYQVNENIIPFSFGSSIFINDQLHSEEELREIIRHEFVHVKQNHSLDIIWGELLCLLNWYNPFAWLLKRSIRQNLEFIADNKVVQNGIDKKEYQYLLLKVIGNSQYSIATQFNFSSLKKRIAMMNKTKSAKRQLGRFLFLVPVFVIILLSFRKSFSEPVDRNTKVETTNIIDSIPANSKGFYIEIADDNGNCTVVVRDKNKKEIKRVLLTEWNAKPNHYENLYGKIPMPTKVAEIEKVMKSMKSKNSDIRTVTVKDNIATVTLKNGKQEVYTLSLYPEKKAFEERCGIKEVAIEAVEQEEIKIATEVISKPVLVTEAELEEVVVTGVKSPTSVSTTIKSVPVTEVELKEATVVGKTSRTIAINPEIKEVTAVGKPSKVSTTVKSNAIAEANVAGTTITSTDQAMIGDLDIKITITNGTTPEQLEKLIGQLKEKGYELKFTDKNYNDRILTQLSGTLKYKGSNSSFSFTDFDQAIIKVYREGDNVEFRIYTGKHKVAL